MLNLGIVSSSIASLPFGDYWAGYYTFDGSPLVTFGTFLDSKVDSSGNSYTAASVYTSDYSGIRLILFKTTSSGIVSWSRFIDLPSATYPNLYYHNPSVSIGASYLYISYSIDYTSGASAIYNTVTHYINFLTGNDVNTPRIFATQNDMMRDSCYFDGSTDYVFYAGIGPASTTGYQGMIYRLSTTLGSVNARSLATSDSALYESINSIVSDGTYVYVAGQDVTNAGFIVKYDSSFSQNAIVRSAVTDSFSKSFYQMVLSGSYVYAIDISNNISRYNVSNLSLSGTPRRITSSVSIAFGGMSADSYGNIYVYGRNTSNNKGFIIKYDSDLNILWQRYIYSGIPSVSAVYRGEVYSIGFSSDQMYVSFGGCLDSSSKVIWKANLPIDGTYTGTYTVGSYTFKYEYADLVETSTSLSTATTTKALTSQTRSTNTQSVSSSTPTADFIEVTF